MKRKGKTLVGASVHESLKRFGHRVKTQEGALPKKRKEQNFHVPKGWEQI